MDKEIQEKANIALSRGKAAEPEETVRNILGCLEKAGLRTVYEEGTCDVDGCFSSRVWLDSPAGRYFGANGKGLSPAFAKASAYGELMERLQNIVFQVRPNLSDPDIERIILGGNETVDLVSDELTGPGKRIVERITAGLPDCMPVFQRDAVMRQILAAFCPGRNQTRSPLLEFYSLRDSSTVMIPEALLSPFILSNGLAAGNTLEEAAVQAVSEIFERRAAEHFLSGGGTPPEIPRDYMHCFPEIEEIIAGIEASGRYCVRLYDCSMGIGMPVVAGAVFDREKIRVGIKFGSHPYMRIALERVFTEALQGSTLESFCERGWISYPGTDCSSFQNTWNHMKVSCGFVHDRIFSGEPSYPFREWPEREIYSERELARRMLSMLDGLCGGVYIRDASFIGFPTVAVYADNFSEVIPVSLTEAKKIKLSRDVADIFARGIENASDGDVEKIERHIRVRSPNLMENTFSAVTGQYPAVRMLGGSEAELPLLRAACLYRLGKFNEAADILARTANAVSSENEDAGFMSAAALYVNGIASGRSEGLAARLLYLSAKKETAEKVISVFSDRRRVLAALYPQCASGCEACGTACHYSDIKRIFTILYENRNRTPINQQHMANLFRKAEETE